MSDTPRTKEEWQRLQRLPNGLYSPKVTTMDLAIGMNRFAKGLERERDSALKSLAELHAALVRYEADVDGEAPSEHHRMMDRAAAILPNAKLPDRHE